MPNLTRQTFGARDHLPGSLPIDCVGEVRLLRRRPCGIQWIGRVMVDVGIDFQEDAVAAMLAATTAAPAFASTATMKKHAPPHATGKQMKMTANHSTSKTTSHNKSSAKTSTHHNNKASSGKASKQEEK